jgi:penicillin amidase
MWRYVLRILVILPLVVLGAGYLWLRSSLPQSDGRLVLPGLTAEVRVVRDAHGVPTISAASDRDAAFALGFVHAQDRLFQMDLMRHYGAGRLSELFGSRTLTIDRTMRTLGLYRAAEQQYAILPAALREALDGYAAGVNAFMDGRRGALSPEYYALTIKPERWRPADTLVWGKIMDLQLSGNYRGELLRARLAQRLSPEDLAVLYPPYPSDGPVTLRDSAALLKGLPLDTLYGALPAAVGPTYASNNWVVDGNHSVSGKPLLANDPHLGFSAPSVWYLARIETPEVKLAGVTAPGTPFVVLGHNERIAWGFTTTASDVEDLFVEQVDPADPTQYMTPDGPRPFTTRQEEIRVRGEAPTTITVRSTRHGPVVSDIGGDMRAVASDGRVLALQATWLAEDDRSPQAVWALDHARDWQSFRDALEPMTAPQQNIVYADVDGNIGFLAPARVPIRAHGNGWMPVPGWTGEYDWTGYVPYAELPSAYNPASGRIVTANNKIVPDDYPYFLGRDWDIPNRAIRINQLLDEHPQQSPNASAAIQADTLSLMARQLLPLMLQVKPSGGRAAQALDRLRSWNGRMDRDKIEPLIFTAWLRELNRAVLADKLGPIFEDYWDLRPNVMKDILTAHQDWCDDRTTPAVETCADQFATALDHALDGLADHYGSDLASWSWGRAHEVSFTHALWSNVPVLRDWFGLRIAADGGNDTVNRGASAIRSATPYADVHGSTLRMIVDLGAPDDARFMITPGESGNPLSAHYGDLMQAWRDFAWLRLGDGAAGGTLVLVPR